MVIPFPYLDRFKIPLGYDCAMLRSETYIQNLLKGLQDLKDRKVGCDLTVSSKVRVQYQNIRLICKIRVNNLLKTYLCSPVRTGGTVLNKKYSNSGTGHV